MNCPDKNTVRDHKTPGGIRLPLSTNMFERTLANRKGLTLVASRNVVCSLARSNSSSSWSNKVVYMVLYSPIVFIPLRRRRRRRRCQKKTRHTYSEHTELLLQDSSRDLNDTLDFSMFFSVSRVDNKSLFIVLVAQWCGGWRVVSDRIFSMHTLFFQWL